MGKLLVRVLLFSVTLTMLASAPVVANEVNVSVKQNISSSSETRIETKESVTVEGTGSAEAIVRAQLRKQEMEKNIEERREEMRKRIEENKSAATLRKTNTKANIASRAADMQQKLEERVKARLQTLFDRMMSRMKAAVERMDSILVRMESRVEKLKADGKNTEDIEDMISSANIALDEVTVDIEATHKEFETVLESAEPRVAFEEMKSIVKENHDQLKTIHQSLVKIIQAIAKLQGTEDEDDDS